MKLIATALSFAAMALPAGDPQGFYVWKSAELKSFSKSLAPKIDAKKVAPQTLPAVGNYSFLVALAAARGVGAGTVRQIVAANTQGRQLGFLGEPRVNVLKLNLALDQAAPLHR